MNEMRDEFLSEEDLDLATMSFDELEAWWNIWLEQAQITNDEDKNEYSHGVFSSIPQRADSPKLASGLASE